MLSLKPGVKMSGLQPQIVLGLISIHSVFEVFGYEATITSINDGHHMDGSLHYRGCAVDLRIRSVDSSDVVGLMAALRRCLGSDFDVVLEVDHIHIEYDPK